MIICHPYALFAYWIEKEREIERDIIYTNIERKIE